MDVDALSLSHLIWWRCKNQSGIATKCNRYRRSSRHSHRYHRQHYGSIVYFTCLMHLSFKKKILRLHCTIAKRGNCRESLSMQICRKIAEIKRQWYQSFVLISQINVVEFRYVFCEVAYIAYR